ncbi:hypothetical protein B0H15DRAFT_621661 [Mycena belliarum]|uniref:Uncharacterized protein n=1 Tax=Mycena belliarum TaxID=1033014 RepID=A0AAD6XUX8_9AGAR|nr:hypothetical protein B0H15DRAFT_621661 [Mycena belliae]
MEVLELTSARAHNIECSTCAAPDPSDFRIPNSQEQSTSWTAPCECNEGDGEDMPYGNALVLNLVIGGFNAYLLLPFDDGTDILGRLRIPGGGPLDSGSRRTADDLSGRFLEVATLRFLRAKTSRDSDKTNPVGAVHAHATTVGCPLRPKNPADHGRWPEKACHPGRQIRGRALRRPPELDWLPLQRRGHRRSPTSKIPNERGPLSHLNLSLDTLDEFRFELAWRMSSTWSQRRTSGRLSALHPAIAMAA